ncbi:MAG: DNA translocase FtsK 4TM domain-containing protein [Gemmatimonadota bacterium]|nr:DNA translocase FtsK 4TM domain-containing protein [Gemmatimonadota bacterium]
MDPTSKPAARSTRSKSSRAGATDDSSLDDLDVVPNPRRTRAPRAEDEDYTPPRARRRAPVTEADIGEPVQGERARRKAKADPDAPTPEQFAKLARREHLKREIGGIALLLGAVFIVGALVAPPAYQSASCADAGSVFGPVGACLRWSVLTLAGALAAAIVPLIPAVHALRLLGRIRDTDDRRWLTFTIGLAVLVPVIASLARGQFGSADLDPLAGLWGAFAAFYLVKAIGNGGAWVVVALALSALSAVALNWNPIRAILGQSAPPKPAADAAITKAEQMEPPAAEMPALDLSLMEGLAPAAAVAQAAPDDAAFELIEPTPAKPDKKGKKKSRDEAVADEIDASELVDPLADELPSLELLSLPPARNVDAGKAQLDAAGLKLMEALRTFRVDGELVGRTSGPTVTQFEIEPAPGVKVRQFANLANDLALAMRAASIRVVAPIPGKGAVGIEVPNPSPEMVIFREMLESRDYQGKPLALPIALGKDLEGRAVVADLAKMPHLLIAGATGSGKSVCVNTIITSLIYRHTPKTLRFLMVDPKMVELSVYNVLPHLRHKVVTDNRDAASMLKWAVLEMQERYQLLAANGARNIQDFNQKVRDGARLLKPKDPSVAFEDREYKGSVLPYIVVVIDELADLMMTCAAEVETPLAMLAQKARAIGIHLILATQRPSVNVITGLIKANFPSRIAFRVASQVDSRTIIDGMGAESLLGNGDMLFIPPGKSEPARLQGAFLSNEDTERLMHWYADRREARKAALEAAGIMHVDMSEDEQDILERVRQQEALEAGAGQESEGDDSDRDKLFREAAEVCIQNQGGSTSLLQRRLKIGYGRAARVIDQLHLAGVLGPPDGSKPRDVLVGLEDLDRICGNREDQE